MAGDVPILVREIAQHEFFTQKVSFNINRRQDHNAAAKLLLLEYRGALVDTKKVNLDRFVKEAVRSESTAIGAAAARVSEQLDRLTPLFEDKDLALKLATGLPVYYWYFRTNEATSQTVQNLRAFENARKSNKQAASLGESELVAEDLQLYDYFNRSPDDATSHERRLQILSKWMNSHAADGVA